MAQKTQTGALYQPGGVGWVEDGRGVQNRGNVCIPMADSCWGLTENNKILWSNYPSVKKRKRKKEPLKYSSFCFVHIKLKIPG